MHGLLRRGAAIRTYDPLAMDEARRVFGDLPGLSIASHQADALRDADALLIVTEWRELKSPDFEQMRALLKQPLLFDGRNLFDPALVRSLGLEDYAIGRGEGPRGGWRWSGRGRRQGQRLGGPSLQVRILSLNSVHRIRYRKRLGGVGRAISACLCPIWVLTCPRWVR